MNRLERGRDGAQTKTGLQWYARTSRAWVLRWAIKKRPITPDKPLCPLVIALVSALLRVQECLLRERKPEKPRTPREAWPAYCSAKNLRVERYSTQTARTSVDGSPSRLIATTFLAFKSILKKPPTRSGFPKFGRDPHHRHHARVFEPSCFGHNLFHECVGGFPLNQHAAH